MKLFFLVLFTVCLFTEASSGDGDYNVKAIPEILTRNANAVVRINTRVFTIEARDRATLSVHMAVTILNEQGKSFATHIIGYDKLTKIQGIKGNVYDANGKLVKKLKSSEIYDQSAFDGITLFSDNRLKAIDLRHGSYPYTVEFEYQIQLKYLFHIPRFILVEEEKLSVASASYSLQYPPQLKPRYKLIAIDQEPRMENIGAIQRLSWTFKNVLPIKEEPHGPGSEFFVPQIVAAPTAFEYADYIGSMSSWDEFGKWVANLNKGRDGLPEKTRQEIIAMTKDLPTIEDKARALYKFLQSKTRYVGIQLGIGGYQPFEASIVDETGYGDCKALSNYMVSMLKVIGIESHYALINAGPHARELDENFVSPQFNHAVVAVPNGRDTLWLECTSQTNPFGYAGSFTGDRKALLITNEGARIAHTPRYTSSQNTQFRSADITIDEAGNGHGRIQTVYAGLQYENSRLDAALNNSHEEQKKWVHQNTRIPSFDVLSFSLNDRKDILPCATVDLELGLNRLATVTGKRLLLVPNLMNRNSYIPPPVDERKSKVVRRIGFTDIDTIRFSLPEGIYPEFVPENVAFTSSFVAYEATFKAAQGKLVYIRKLTMRKGEFPASAYQELIDFYRKISRADNTKMVFITKT